MLTAVAILCARELSIRQHIMLFVVIVIRLYIVHASFRVDGVSISVLTYYVNRLFDYFSKFSKSLILLRLQGFYAGVGRIFSRTFGKNSEL